MQIEFAYAFEKNVATNDSLWSLCHRETILSDLSEEPEAVFYML